MLKYESKKKINIIYYPLTNQLTQKSVDITKNLNK